MYIRTYDGVYGEAYDFRVHGRRGVQEIVTPDKTSLLEQQVAGINLLRTRFKNWRNGERGERTIYSVNASRLGSKKICF